MKWHSSSAIPWKNLSNPGILLHLAPKPGQGTHLHVIKFHGAGFIPKKPCWNINLWQHRNHQLENGFIQKKATWVIFLWLVNYPRVTGGSRVTLISLHSSQEREDSRQTQESPRGAPWTGDAVTTLQNRPKFLQKGGKHWLGTWILTQASSRIVLTGITLGRVPSSI